MNTSPDKSDARQFSLRKLMLWMVVVGAYLGVLRLTGSGATHATFVTAWVAVVVIVQVGWGIKGGVIAVLGMAIVYPGQFLGSWMVSESPAAAIAAGLVVWLIAACYGLAGYVCVTLVMRFVSWLDALGPRGHSKRDSKIENGT